MQLMRVERVCFLRSIFNSPVLDISLMNRNVGLCRMGIEEYRGLTFFGNEKDGRAFWIVGVN